MLLALVIYACWAIVVWFHERLPLWLLGTIGGWLVAWHGSLQHEAIHGHPTSSSRLNAIIGGVPLALWLPYRCYARDHLAHHAADAITHPACDPESRYLLRSIGARARIRRIVARLQAPLLGRLVLGPPVVIGTFLLNELRRLRTDPASVARDWLPHVVASTIVVGWLLASRMPIGFYLAMFVYPGTALTLLRSFAEHRAASLPGHRVAIVEGGGPFALLFLNNNLHAAHHLAPALAWFRLPAFYRYHRERILADNGGLLYRGYGEILRRFGLRAHDVVLHPHLP